MINDDVRYKFSNTMHSALLGNFPPFLSLEFATCGAKVINVMCFFHFHYLYGSLIYLCLIQFLFKLSNGYLYFLNFNFICLND